MNGSTILVVDDHVVNRQFLLTLLGYYGHRLLEARDGAEALRLMQGEKPDLVIADIMMPGMDGEEMVRRMREDPGLAAVPVIFYTATYRAREAKVIAQSCRVAWVLAKPSEPELILATVAEALASAEGAAAGEAPPAAAPSHPGLPRSELPAADSVRELQAISLRQTALLELGIDLAAMRQAAELLETGCHAAARLCRAGYALLGLFDAGGEELAELHGYGLAPERLAALKPELGDGILRRLRAHSVPCRLRGLDGDPRALGLPAAHPELQAFLGVSIASRSRCHGWLYVANKLDAEEFSEVDAYALATLAGQLALAYENLCLYEEVQNQHALLREEASRRLQAQDALRKSLHARTVVARCSHVLVHASDEASLLEQTCQALVAVGGYALVWVGYADESGALVPIAQASQSPDVQSLGAARLDAGALAGALAGCPAEADFREGRLLLIDDLAAQPAAAHCGACLAAKPRGSALSLPLLCDGQAFGSLNLYAREPGTFDPEQCRTFEELAADLAYGIAHLRDKAARARAESALQASEARRANILNTLDDVDWSYALPFGECLYLSPSAHKLYGRTAESLMESPELLAQLVLKEDRAAYAAARGRLQDYGEASYEYRIRRADGELRWCLDRARLARDPLGRPVRVDGVTSDITERRRQEERIAYLANYDALTGLANRNLLADRYAQGAAIAGRLGKRLALLQIDLDRFQDINIRHGQSIGDGVLVAVAQRLGRAVREGDTVARRGEDRFTLLLANVESYDEVAALAAKLLAALAPPLAVEGQVLTVKASIGAALFPEDGDELATLVNHAEMALARAKGAGGGGCQFYESALGARAHERLSLEAELRLALAREQLELHYQPQVDLGNGRIVGAEALLRWRHPKLGLVPPGRFIAIAEDSGLILPIGEWVLATACRAARIWAEAGAGPLSVAVNLSARQFRQAELEALVRRQLDDSGLPPSRLELELTESMMMDDPAQARALLSRLAALGVRLSVDDFGTGYSSLAYLKCFPIHTIKIDQSFVRDITTDADDAAIAKTIISIAHDMRLSAIAEGVEEEAQARFLRRHGCDTIQGYWFSRPVPAEQFLELAKSGIRMRLKEEIGDRCLLVVDDESHVRTALARALRGEDYRLLQAGSGAEALQLLAQHEVGVIISDYRMPDMNGVDLLGRARTLSPRSVRLILSGYADFKAVTSAVNEGAIYRFLSKPWNDGDLKRHLREAFAAYAAAAASERSAGAA